MLSKREALFEKKKYGHFHTFLHMNVCLCTLRKEIVMLVYLFSH